MKFNDNEVFIIRNGEKKEYYPTSSEQKRLFFLQQMNPNSTAFNLFHSKEQQHNVSRKDVEESFNKLLLRHNIFFTNFHIKGEELIQRVNNNIKIEIEEYWTQRSEVDAIQKYFMRSFDLNLSPLFRVALVHIDGENDVLMINTHSIICDILSCEVILSEFNRVLSGEKLSPSRLDYRDCLEWKNKKLNNQDQRSPSQLLYKTNILSLYKSFDNVSPFEQKDDRNITSFKLNKGETQIIKLFAKENDLSLYTSLMSIYVLLLSKLGSLDEMIIHTTINDRNCDELFDIVGMFERDLSIPFKFSDNDKLEEFIQILKETIKKKVNCNNNCQTDEFSGSVFDEIIENRNPLFNVMFNFTDKVLENNDNLSFISQTKVPKYALALNGYNLTNEILLNLEYSESFKPEFIEKFITYFKFLVVEFKNVISNEISLINLLNESEKNKILYELNKTKVDYPEDKSISVIFEEQVRENPDNIALVWKDLQVSYSELDKKSNQISSYLVSIGISPNSVVGLLFEPCLEIVISILGVLKAGAVYLPINPDFPMNRIDYVLKDSGSKVVLTSGMNKIQNLPKVDTIRVDDILDNEEFNNSFNINQNADLTYIIYTSGTTGNPKGVVISNRNLVNYVNWINRTILFQKSDRAVLTTNFAFDAIYTLLFGALLNGSRLNIIPKEVYLNLKMLTELIDKENITLLKMTPSLFNILINGGILKQENLKTIRFLMLGGEAINTSDVEKLYRHNEKVKIMNHYGPTETTIGSIATYIDVEELTEYIDRPHVGKPIDNTNLYILDKYNEIQPFDVLGELCISGDGLALGYLNNPELTSEKFSENPFEKGSHLYKTGDLARRRYDGNIELIGRTDQQVKIRGYRIELAEIENVLLKNENVNECVVVVIEDNNDKQLCAYVNCNRIEEIEKLREFLTGFLPEYMIPTYFVHVDQFSLSTNGKINRNALPDPKSINNKDRLSSVRKEINNERDYWENEFVNSFDELVKKTINNESSLNDYVIREFIFSKEHSSALIKMSENNDIALFTILLSLLFILNKKCNDEKSFVVWIPIMRNDNVETFYTDVLPIIIDIDKSYTIVDILHTVKNKLIQANKHANFHIEQIFKMNQLNHEKKSIGSFDIGMSFDSVNNYKFIKNKKPLILYRFKKDNDRIILNLEFEKSHFGEQSIGTLYKRYEIITQHLVKNPRIRVEDISIFVEDEIDSLMKFSNRNTRFSNYNNLIQLFSSKIAENSLKVFYRYGDFQITYSKFFEEAQKIQKYLVSKEIPKKIRIAFSCENSFDNLLSFWGVLLHESVYISIPGDISDEEKNNIIRQEKVEIFIDKFDSTNTELSNVKYQSLKAKKYQENTSNLIGCCYFTYEGKVNCEYVNFNDVERYWDDISNINKDQNQLITSFIDNPSQIWMFRKLITTVSVGGCLVDYNTNKQNLDPFLSKQCPDVLIIPIQFVYRENIEIGNNNLKKIILVGKRLRKKTTNNFINNFNDKTEIIFEYCPLKNSQLINLYKLSSQDNSCNKNFLYGLSTDNNSLFLNNSGFFIPNGGIGYYYLPSNDLENHYSFSNEIINKKVHAKNNSQYKGYFNTSIKVKKEFDKGFQIIEENSEIKNVNGYYFNKEEFEGVLNDHLAIKDSYIDTDRISSNNQITIYYVSDKKILTEEIFKYLNNFYQISNTKIELIRVLEIPYSFFGDVDLSKMSILDHPDKNELDINHIDIHQKVIGLWSQVLNIKKHEIDMNSDFFLLGGHSLKAVLIATTLSREFNVEVTINDLFNNRTLKQLIESIANKKTSSVSIPVSEKKMYYNLYSSPKRLFVIQDLLKDSIAYNVFKTYELPFKLEFDEIERIFQILIQRHESFRTYIKVIDAEPVQIVLDKVDFSIELFDKGEDEDEIIKAFVSPFDLSVAPLLRVGCIKRKNGSVKLLVDMHHIISDAMSQNVLIKEFIEIYKKKELMPIRIQYKDYSEWKKSEKQIKKAESQQDYWLNQFNDFIPGIKLPYDFERPNIQGFDGATVSFLIDKDTTSGLMSVGSDDTTLFMKLLSIYAILISKISNNEDVAIGTHLAGRNDIELHDIVGMFVNTIALRLKPESDINYNKFLTNVKDIVMESFANQEFLFEDLISNLPSIRDTSRNALFDVCFIYHDYEGTEYDFNNLDNIDWGVHRSGISKFDIMLNASNFGDVIVAEIQYNTGLFLEETINRFIQYFNNILNAVTKDCEQPISEIGILSQSDKKRILNDFNNTESKFEDLFIYDLFNSQVRSNGNKQAVKFTVDFFNAYMTMTDDHEEFNDDGSYLVQEQYTYNEINRRVVELSSYLVSLGVEKNEVIGVLFYPSIEMIVSILALLKIGAIYMPIDPEVPLSRVEYMLKDSNCNCILTQTELSNIVPSGLSKVLVDDIPSKSELNLVDHERCGENAYIIYTSGSTGQPKGVLVKNKNLSNYAQWFTREFKLDSSDKTILTSSYSFDLGYSSIYPILSSGGELHLLEKEHYLNPDKLLAYLSKNQISYLKMTPSFISYLCSLKDFNDDILHSLRLIILGGESINYNDLQLIFDKKSDIEIVNHYGPTEATIGCVFNKISKNDLSYHKKQIIGKPISNAKAYILNDKVDLLPIGSDGELCIQGEGITSGYINNPEITHSKYVYNQTINSSVIYKTGDKARRLHDGRIEFLGRKDNQIKIRGYRVELGEIENNIKKIRGVGNSVVQIQEDRNEEKYICAFIEKSKLFDKHVLVKDSEEKLLLDELQNSKNKYGEKKETDEKILLKSRQISNFILENYKVVSSLSSNEKSRYKRQLILDGWGIGSQELLKSLTVFVAGAGGGASPIITQLALLGVGKIIVCDYDIVELSNLNRQFLHDESRLSENKAQSAKKTIERLNPNVKVEAINEKMTNKNAMEMIGNADIIFDMFDGMKEKFLLSKCALELKVPHVVTAMVDINSYSAIFYPPFTACFHCVFDEKKLDVIQKGFTEFYGGHNKKSLAVAASSLFTSSGFIINEVLKLCLGLSKPSINKFFYFNQKKDRSIFSADSYKAMTYVFSDFFKEESVKQGCDWDNGWDGKSLEEIKIVKNDQCTNCGSVDNEVLDSNSFRQNIISKAEVEESNKEEKCVGVYVKSLKYLLLATNAITDCGMTVIPIDSNLDTDNVEKVIDEYSIRLIITASNLENKIAKLIKETKRNIKILDISNEVTPNSDFKLNEIYNNQDKSLKIAKYEFVIDSFINLGYVDGNFNIDLSDLEDDLRYTRIANNLFSDLLLDTCTSGDIDVTEEKINKILSRNLPEYMIPAKYIFMDNFPITNNGKINYAELPSPESNDKKIEPNSDLERLLIEVWEEYLGQSINSLDTTFFASGGDSIKAIQILSKLHSMGYSLEMNDIFDNPTISSLAKRIENILWVNDESEQDWNEENEVVI